MSESGRHLAQQSAQLAFDERQARDQVDGLRSFALIGGGINMLGIAILALSEFLLRTQGWNALDWLRELAEGTVQIACAALVYVGVVRLAKSASQRLAMGAALYAMLGGISTYYDARYLDIKTVTIHPSWVCLLVLVYALLVPASGRHHAALLIAACVALPLSALLIDASGLAYADATALQVAIAACAAALPTWICAAIAGVVVGRNLKQRQRLRAMADNLAMLGSYRLERQLGEGGMGEVWQASHALLARPAAVKLIRTDTLVGQGTSGTVQPRVALKRFEREAQVTASLNSPHTIRLYDYGRSTDGVFFYVMEMLDGLDLETLLREFGPQPQERVRHVLMQCCDSLAEAHAAGLIHRDIKPANIFLCRQGVQLDVVKVLDFGLVISHHAVALPPPEADEDRDDEDHSSHNPRLTAKGLIQGTPTCMAPEQARAASDLDHRCDLYALGCVAYMLLTASYVFDEIEPRKLMALHAWSTPTPPSERFPRVVVAPEFEALIMKLLSNKPSGRYANAEDLRDALDAITLPGRWDRHSAQAWWQRHAPQLASLRAQPRPQDSTAIEEAETVQMPAHTPLANTARMGTIVKQHEPPS